MKLTIDNFEQESKIGKPKNKNWIKVGLSTCGIAAGADVAFETIQKAVKENKLDVSVLRTGCAGKCYAEPLVEVKTEGVARVVYGGVDKEVAEKIVQKHLMAKQLIDDHIYSIIKEENNGEV